MPLTYLQVGSWNIKHLGQQPTEDERSQSVYALTDQIELGGVDVLALQEIYVTHTDGAERRNEFLDRVCELLIEHTDVGWAYKVLENRDPDDVSQLCAVLWNESILQLVTAVSIPVTFQDGSDRLWDRKPHAVKFETTEEILGSKRSIVLVPLHMKANGRDRRAKQKRAKEAEQLAQQVPWIIEQMEEESIMLIGDSNILGAWEDAASTLEEAGFEDLNVEDDPTYAGGKAPFDRIFVKSDRPEFRYSRQYSMRSASASSHERYLSDHYMIKTSVKIYVDT